MSPPLRPILPCPPGAKSTSEGSTSSQKRKVTKIACKPCQQRKYKCDGTRPACRACVGKSLPCHYDYAEGQERPSLKRKNLELQRDLGSTLELLHHLRHGSEDDARNLFTRIREGEDPSTIVASLNQLGIGTNIPNRSPTPREDVSPERTEEAAPPSRPAPGLIDQKSHLITLPLGHGPAPKLPPIGHPTYENHTDPPMIPPIRSIIGPHERMMVSDTSKPKVLAESIRAQRETIRQSYSTFLQCSATSFHVYSQEQVNGLLDAFRPECTDISLSTLCSTCAVAAVGERFYPGPVSPSDYSHFFNAAKQLLDDCIDQTPLQAIKVCALLGMCNIITKSTAALAYIELGLGLARSQGIFGEQCRPDLDIGTWNDKRRVCQIMIFYRGWLRVTSSITTIETDDAVTSHNLDKFGDSDVIRNSGIQVEVLAMIKIMMHICRVVLSTRFSLSWSRGIQSLFHDWLQTLPDQMRLDLRTRLLDPNERVYMLSLHSFSFGGKMLMYRWVLSSFIDPGLEHGAMTQETQEDTTNCIEDGILSAGKAAEILHVFYMEGMAVKYFWFCMFQAYLSCCILLYDDLQRILCSEPLESPSKNLEWVEKSLEVLAWASKLSKRAHQFHDILHPIYELVKGSAVSYHIRRSPPRHLHYHFAIVEGTSPLQQAAQKLNRLLFIPLVTISKQTHIQSNVPSDQEPLLPRFADAGLGMHLYWALEFAAPCFSSDDFAQSDSGTSSGALF
ncbi:hypothetical protein BU24DRAFT_452012 [Aaosphaeria arxii CBS 175.79]|uniref:Zn(2)-C6 fungal-type domain-containing protein n=1 Tax=Aaosphaeria arxii CBS 175.79 TaxID=1450172 RepID=A0A6A5XPG5_9PLEO|nr:uncharacterized protein BU24DRAFT_452012 [Aaosphaeria arxii CBS 175.79]KAF2015138.1 hypothetical protein BU24DRAFT_452012 [Aaosphaeria arxii CBS 175.79]